MTIASWVEKYGKITAYTTAVVLVTAVAIRLDGSIHSGNEKLQTITTQMSTLQQQVGSLQTLLADREKYERWRKMYNLRLKRLYAAQGWEYEEVE